MQMSQWGIVFLIIVIFTIAAIVYLGETSPVELHVPQ